MRQSGYAKIKQRLRVRNILESEHTVTLVIQNFLSSQYLENIRSWACFNETQVLRACTVFARQRVPQLWSSRTDPFSISLKLKNESSDFANMLWCYRQLSFLMLENGATSKFTDTPVLSNFKISNIDLKFTINLVAVAPSRGYTF